MRHKQLAPPPEPPTIRLTTAGTAAMRKKGASVRSWLIVDANGQAEGMEVGKHAIMRRTGLPARDLRMLDPVLSYPSTILGRERAIVVNLEHIKAIITSQEVLFVNSSDPLMSPFVKKLQGMLRHRNAFKSAQEATLDSNQVELGNLPNAEEPQSPAVSPRGLNHSEGFSDKNEEGNADGGQDPATAHDLKLLPLEFVALEACLDAVCSCLDNEASGLEQEAHPALDKLTSQISTLNLERVRQIKSRLVAMTGRVQKVRDELEHLLDDDEDMAEMYLTEKFEQQLENSSGSSVNELNDVVEEEDPSTVQTRIRGTSIECDESSVKSDTDIRETEDQSEKRTFEPFPLRRDSHRSHASTHSSSSKRLDVEELEMILEPYFVQIEGTLNKLSNLREYVDDTEDYINIMLDDKQNSLLQMGVMLTTATVVVSAFVAVTGVFGMNIQIDLFSDAKAGMPEFLWTIGGGTAGCVFLYAAAIAWCRHERLLE